MAVIDIIILVLFVWGAYRGWKHGLLKEITSTVGFIAGLYIAYRCYETFGTYLAPYLGGEDSSVGMFLVSVVAFIIIWVVVPVALGLTATLLTRLLKVVKLGAVNRLLGLLLGLVKYALLLSIVFAAFKVVGLLDDKKTAGTVIYPEVAAFGENFFREYQLNKEIAARIMQTGQTDENSAAGDGCHNNKK